MANERIRTVHGDSDIVLTQARHNGRPEGVISPGAGETVTVEGTEDVFQNTWAHLRRLQRQDRRGTGL